MLKAYLVVLFKACESDPARARVLFKAHFEKEPLVLTPISEGPDRFYEATGAFFLWTSEVLGKSSCGGRISGVDAEWVTLPVEVRLAA